MVRKILKKTSKHNKLKILIKRYNISPEYLSTNRRMVSKAVFFGLFIAFIPMPMQMLAVLTLIPFVKFNVPIALAMCWLSNPFTMPAMYYLEYLTGAFLLGLETISVEMSINWFSTNIDSIFIPLYLGSLFYSIFGSSLGYLAVNYFWKASVKKDKKLHRNNRK